VVSRRIAAAGGRFSSIRQVAPTCPLVRTRWHHLANTIELVFPSAHLSPQPKRQVDRLSRFAQLTAESPYTLQWASLSPKLPLSIGESGPHLMSDSLAPSEPQPKWHLDGFSRFCTDDRRLSLYFTMGRPFSHKITPSHGGGSGSPSNTWFLGLPESSTQMASRSVQPFSQGSLVSQTDRQTDRQTALLGR